MSPLDNSNHTLIELLNSMRQEQLIVLAERFNLLSEEKVVDVTVTPQKLRTELKIVMAFYPEVTCLISCFEHLRETFYHHEDDHKEQNNENTVLAPE